MSDETNPSAEEAPTEEFEKPKVRRISNKNPGRSTKETEGDRGADDTSAEQPTSGEENGGSQPEQKRSNRRRRGKKSSKDSSAGASDEETINLGEDDSQVQGDEGKKPRDQDRNQRKPKSRSKVDPDKLANKAWKIFLAEVSEEGVALIADKDARDLARRCFRLAELFLEEEEHRS